MKKTLEDVLLYRRVVEWDETKLVLDDGTTVSIEETDYDCCASAGGSWSAVELDAVITDVVRGEEEPWDNGDTYGTSVTVKLYHNQNPIAQADLDAADGVLGLAFHLIGLTFALHLLVTERLAGAFRDVAAERDATGALEEDAGPAELHRAAVGLDDFAQHARSRSGNFQNDLVGFDFDQDFVSLDHFARLFFPFQQGCFGDGFRELGNQNVSNCHDYIFRI